MLGGSLVFLLLLGSITECSLFFRSHNVRRWKQGDKIWKPSILIIRNAAHEILDDKEPILSKALITDEGRLAAQRFGKQLKMMPKNFVSCPAGNCIDTIEEIMKSAGVDAERYTKDKLLSYSSFWKEPESVADLIKRFGRKEFYEEFVQYWLDGAPDAEILQLKDEWSDHILEKYSDKLGKDITLMVAHGFTIEAIARAGGLPAEGPGPSDWCKHLEGIIITRKKHHEL